MRCRTAARSPCALAAPRRRCSWKVHDSGVGMDEETRRRCLEPFFTTKGERGTGLGLAMVYGMVRRHSAELEIDSVLHRGTTLRVTFPAALTAAACAAGRRAGGRRYDRCRS